MRGLLGGAVSKGSDKGGAPEGAAATETEELDEKEGSILLNMISQLRPGMELSRITFPTFVLEPRSMLERITDFLSHPDLIFGAGEIDDPHERFISVLRYYLAGWHIKPKGVKKPYNPVLGETFRCRYRYKDGTQGFYIAEQVSHHPPISAFYYVSPEHKIEVFGELRPKSRFLGNSVMNEMSGANHIVLLDRPEDGTYDITMPNQYARGILFGKMVLELGDIAKVSNSNIGISCDVDFKTKGFFSGSYNTIAGKIKTDKGEIGEISGKWSDQMYIQRSKGQKELFFDANEAVAVPKEVLAEEDQLETESRRLWSKVTDAIKRGDQEAATDNKTAIEDRQRELARLREDAGEDWHPHHFELRNDEYRAKFSVPKGSVEEQIEAVEMFVFGTTTPKTEEDHEQPVSPPKKKLVAEPAPMEQSPTKPSASAVGQGPSSTTSTPAGAVAMTAQTSQGSALASSPESSHGHGLLNKLGSVRKKHSGSVSLPYFSSSKSPLPPSNPPDHAASSRHVPAPQGN